MNTKSQAFEGKDKAHLFDYLHQDWFVAVWCYLYRSETLKNNKLRFNENLNLMEDFGFNTLAFIMAKRIQFIDDLLYFCRETPGSLTTRDDVEPFSLDNDRTVACDVWEFCKNKKILKNHKERFLVYLTGSLWYTLNQLIESKKNFGSRFFPCVNCPSERGLACDILAIYRIFYCEEELEKYCLKGLKNIDGCTCEKCLESIKVASEQLNLIYKLAR